MSFLKGLFSKAKGNGSEKSPEFIFFGDYEHWQKALDQSRGYDEDKLLSKIEAPLKDVVAGRLFERDGFVSPKPFYSWPGLALLLWIAQREKSLRVLDFGGSLGTTFFNHRKFLAQIENLVWIIVEQKNFVAAGKKIETDQLRFFETIHEACQKIQPHVIFCSGSLQYIPDPSAILETMIESNVKYILIDRTPTWNGSRNRLTIQKSDTGGMETSYPGWFFPENFFSEALAPNYKLIECFDALDGTYGIEGGDVGVFKGFLFEKT